MTAHAYRASAHKMGPVDVRTTGRGCSWIHMDRRVHYASWYIHQTHAKRTHAKPKCESGTRTTHTHTRLVCKGHHALDELPVVTPMLLQNEKIFRFLLTRYGRSYVQNLDKEGGARKMWRAATAGWAEADSPSQ